MKKSKKRFVIISIVLIFLLSSAAGFIIYKKSSDKKASMLKSSEEEQSYPVTTAVCVEGEIYDFIKINGSVVADKSVDVNPDTGGRLKTVYAEIGDYIRKGDIIADIDPSKPGLSYTSSPVRSPIEGTVTQLPLESGSTVTVASVIATVGDLSKLRIVTEIPEPEISKIRMGSESITSFAAYPDNTYLAEVVEISPVVNPLTRTMKIKLDFTDKHDEVKAGMFGSIKLVTEKKLSTLKIPSSSVVVRDGRDTVFILENDRVIKKNITTGITSEGVTEVISGIAAGDIVITAGQNLLEDKVKVKIISGSSGNKDEN